MKISLSSGKKVHYIAIVMLLFACNIFTSAQDTIPLTSDAHIHSWSGNVDANFDANETMIIKTNADENIDRLGLIKVDLDTINKYDVIDSVKIFYSFHNCHNGNIDIFKYEYEYSSDTITWNNSPSTVLQSSDSITSWFTESSWNRQDAYHGLDITAYAIERLAIDSVMSLALRGEASGSGYDLHTLESVADGNGIVWSPYAVVYGRNFDTEQKGILSDAHIHSWSGNVDVNFDASANMVIKTNADGSIDRLGLVKIDLDSISDFASIDSVKLFYSFHNCHAGNIDIFKFEYDYSSDTITWNNAPSTVLPSSDSITTWITEASWNRQDAFHGLDITSYALERLAVDSVISLALKGEASGSGYDIHALENTDDGGIWTPYVEVIGTLNNYIPSDDTTLADLTIDGTTIEGFDPVTATYDVELAKGTTEVVVDATPNDDHATVSGTGTVDVSSGSATSVITVTAEDVSDMDYTINLTVAAQSDNAFLHSLTIDIGTLIPEFDSATFSYTVSLPSGTDTVVVTPVLSDTENATLTGGGKIDVSDDKVTALVEVTAEDGTIQTYSIFFKLQSEDAIKMPLTSDTHIHSYSGNVDNNYDASENIIAKTNTDGSFDRLALAKVDIRAMSSFETIDSVYLFYSFHNCHDGIIDIFRYDHDYGSDTITWNNAPSTELASSDSITTWITKSSWNREDAYHGVNISAYVQERLAVDSVVSLALRAESSGNGFDLHALEISADGNGVVWSPYIEIYGKLAEGVKSNDASLSDLTVDGTTLDGFSSTITNYTVLLPEGTTGATIVATANHDSATVNGDGEIDVSSGSGVATITVLAEDSISTKTYTITLNVGWLKSDNAYLDSLTYDVGVLLPIFDSATFEYTLNVPASTSTVTLEAFTSSDSATVVGDGAIDVSNGDTTVSIVVTAEDETTELTYEVAIKVLSDDATLSSLTSSPEGTFTPAFDPSTASYALLVPEGTSIVNFFAETTHENAVIEGLGSVNVTSESGSILITVTSEDGTATKDYSVDITVETSTEISGILTEDISVYPNPVAEKLYIDAGLNSDISIYDINGQFITGIISIESKTEIDVSHYFAGSYIIVVRSNDNEVLRTVFIKH